MDCVIPRIKGAFPEPIFPAILKELDFAWRPDYWNYQLGGPYVYITFRQWYLKYPDSFGMIQYGDI